LLSRTVAAAVRDPSDVSRDRRGDGLLVVDGLNRVVRDPAQELIVLECTRLNRLLRAISPKAIGVTTGLPAITIAMARDLLAVDRVLTIQRNP
jgi:hypothetical protein